MTMQLSEKAKQLIPKSRIVSFASWKSLYSEDVISIFQEADDNGRYLTDAELDQIKALIPSQPISLEPAKLLRDQAPTLIAKARERVLMKFPQITEPGNDLYPPERAEACWRDFWHFLRCITYGIAGRSPQFTSPEGLANMKLLYQELGVPLGAMICGLESLKVLSLEEFDPDEQDSLSLYFDHLILALKQFN